MASASAAHVYCRRRCRCHCCAMRTVSIAERSCAAVRRSTGSLLQRLGRLAGRTGTCPSTPCWHRANRRWRCTTAFPSSGRGSTAMRCACHCSYRSSATGQVLCRPLCALPLPHEGSSGWRRSAWLLPIDAATGAHADRTNLTSGTDAYLPIQAIVSSECLGHSGALLGVRLAPPLQRATGWASLRAVCVPDVARHCSVSAAYPV